MSATAEHKLYPSGGGRETLTAFRAPPGLIAALRAERERSGKSVSALIREAVTEMLDKKDDELTP